MHDPGPVLSPPPPPPPISSPPHFRSFQVSATHRTALMPLWIASPRASTPINQRHSPTLTTPNSNIRASQSTPFRIAFAMSAAVTLPSFTIPTPRREAAQNVHQCHRRTLIFASPPFLMQMARLPQLTKIPCYRKTDCAADHTQGRDPAPDLLPPSSCNNIQAPRQPQLRTVNKIGEDVRTRARCI